MAAGSPRTIERSHQIARPRQLRSTSAPNCLLHRAQSIRGLHNSTDLSFDPPVTAAWTRVCQLKLKTFAPSNRQTASCLAHLCLPRRRSRRLHKSSLSYNKNCPQGRSSSHPVRHSKRSISKCMNLKHQRLRARLTVERSSAYNSSHFWLRSSLERHEWSDVVARS